MARIDTSRLGDGAGFGEPLPTKIDGQATLRKLTGGQALTDEEKKYLNLPVAPAATGAPTGSGTPPVGGDGKPKDKEEKPPVEITLVDTITDAYGNTIGIYSDGSKKTLASSGRKYKDTVNMDAYGILEAAFKDYGLDDLVPVIQRYMDEGLGSEQASLALKSEPAYLKRFDGNEQRRKAGLNVLSEAEYLNLENAYSETLKSFGLASYFGADAKTRQAKMADVIGGDVSPTEFKDRVDTVATRVKNADPAIKETLTSFFGIKEEDLLTYFLNPKDNLPKLQEKVTAAEIGAAAKGQNLATSAEAATALAQFGVTQAQAREGYANIGEIMPTATKLGDIYGNKYDQATAEAEVFKGTASAKRKRQQLAEQEVASFSGSSGRLRTGQQSGNTGSF
jgi:hypothetical protein